MRGRDVSIAAMDREIEIDDGPVLAALHVLETSAGEVEPRHYFSSASQRISDLNEIALRLLDLHQQRATELQSHAVLLLYYVYGALFTVALLLGFLGRAIMSRVPPLRLVTSRLGALADGDYGYGPLQVMAEGGDEIAVLKRSCNHLAEQLRRSSRETTEQQWLNAGLEKINTIARGEDSLRILASAICAFLADYLEAQLVVFYRTANQQLHLLGAYANSPDRRGDLASSIGFGVGLTGQVAVDGRVLEVNDVPDDFIRI